MSTIILVIATVALMIFINGLYVAAEFSTVSVRKTRISQMAGKGNRMAQWLLPVVENSESLDRYVAACQVGITISSLVVGAYGQNVIAVALVSPLGSLMERSSGLLAGFGINASPAAAKTASGTVAAVLVLLLITTLQVVFGELFPKSLAIQFPEKTALSVVVPMRWSLVILRPFISLFNGSGNLVLRLLGHQPRAKHGQVHSPGEIELLVSESHLGGLLDDIERQMLRNAFRLRDLTARQVMVHRTRLLAMSVNSSITDIMDRVIEAGYSRIPIYEESIDDIVGFVHIKDLFRLHVQGKGDFRATIRDVVYVPEMLPIVDVWEKLNSRRKYLAIVFDEYGGTAGLITFEDLIEEIFGELQDEFDDEVALIARDRQGRIYLRGDLLVSDVNEYLKLNLPDDSADTLSGLIFSELGRTPVDGEEVSINDTVIRVEAMADLGVAEVSLLLPLADRIAAYSEWEVADHE
ncbi:MAG: hemolysin family protein [Anaerolineae bacterium]